MYRKQKYCESYNSLSTMKEEPIFCAVKEEPHDEIRIRPLSPTTRNKKGQFIHKRERLLIVNLYKDLKEESPEVSKKKAYAMLSKKTGFGVSSIKKTMLEYERTGHVSSPNKKRHRITSNQKIDEGGRNAIRKKIHEFYINKELPTLAKVLQAVNNDPNLPNFKRTNFWKLLKELNFTYVGRSHNSVLTERDDIILWRRDYLKAIRKFREEGRPIYYLDETWVNADDVSPKIWMDTKIKVEKDPFAGELSTGSSNSTGKGKWLIALHIGSTAGFVPGGFLCIESKKNIWDYYDEMNGDTFLEWFEKILPSLQDNAVIVMDNAPHHCVKSEKVPDASWKKKAIAEWLEHKGQVVDMTMLKAELLQTVALIKDNYAEYVIDEKARKQNKTVLRLPSYHCELNPIEMIWSMVKEHVKNYNCTFDVNDVKLLVEQGVECVRAEHWNNSVQHVIEEEKRFWVFDEIADRLIDEIPSLKANVGSESDTDSDYSDY